MSKIMGMLDEGGDTDRLAAAAAAVSDDAVELAAVGGKAEADIRGVEAKFELMRAKGSAAGRDPTGGSWAGTGAVAPEAFAEEDEARITAAAAAALGAAVRLLRPGTKGAWNKPTNNSANNT